MQIDWFTFGAQVVNFLILVALLRHFLYGPIVDAMAAREQRIAARLDEAADREAAAEAEEEAFRSRRKALNEDRERLMAEARAEAEATRRRLVREAREEVQQVERQWIEALRRDRARAIEGLRQEAGMQIVTAARRVLDDLADTSLEGQVVATFVDRLDGAEVDIPGATGEVTLRSAFPLTGSQQADVEAALRDRLGIGGPVRTEVDGDLVCGLQVRGEGWTIGWNVQEYLRDLETRIEALLDDVHAATGPEEETMEDAEDEGTEAPANGATGPAQTDREVQP